MELKNLSKNQLMELLAKKEIELNAKNELIEKNNIKPKKAKFDNIILIKACLYSLMHIDNGINIELKEQLALLNSIGDKWNYCAFLHKALIFMKKNDIDISRLPLKNDNASLEFKAIKDIFNELMKQEKNINIPKKDNEYNAIA